jgi:GMP reductase
VSDADYEKLCQVVNTGLIDNICVDVANGYSPYLINFVRKVRAAWPKALIMAGNVVTGDMCEDLLLNGADIVKVGIGPGSVCTTRKLTGVGRPQFSTVIECADAAHQVGGMVCADGGITCPGDIGKAFGAGGDFVMIGGLYAGTDEAEGEIVERYYKTGEVTVDHAPVYICKKFKQFYGMSSTLAQEKFGNGKPSYRASEGRVTLVPYVGSVDDVNEEFLGGLRSTMTYLGAKRLKDIPKCCVFYRVYHQLNTTYENNTIGK